MPSVVTSSITAANLPAGDESPGLGEGSLHERGGDATGYPYRLTVADTHATPEQRALGHAEQLGGEGARPSSIDALLDRPIGQHLRPGGEGVGRGEPHRFARGGHLAGHRGDRAEIGEPGRLEDRRALLEEGGRGRRRGRRPRGEVRLDELAVGTSPSTRSTAAPSSSLPPGKWWYSEPYGASAASRIAFTPVACVAPLAEQLARRVGEALTRRTFVATGPRHGDTCYSYRSIDL